MDLLICFWGIFAEKKAPPKERGHFARNGIVKGFFSERGEPLRYGSTWHLQPFFLFLILKLAVFVFGTKTKKLRFFGATKAEKSNNWRISLSKLTSAWFVLHFALRQLP